MAFHSHPLVLIPIVWILYWKPIIALVINNIAHNLITEIYIIYLYICLNDEKAYNFNDFSFILLKQNSKYTACIVIFN